MIAVEYLSDLRKASGDGVLADLLAGAGAPFDRAEWWERLRRYCGFVPLYALARSRDGAALLALRQDGGSITTLANRYAFRWRPLVSPSAARAPLFEALARDLARRAWHVSLPALPEEDATGSDLARAFRRAGWLTRCRSHASNYVVRVGGRGYDDYRAGLPGTLKRRLKRKAGRVHCAIHTRFSDDIWDIYQSIDAASLKPGQDQPEFLRAFAASEAAGGRLRLGIASYDGDPVAAQLWTVEAGTAYIHRLAHREDARAQSPGSVLSAALFRQAIDHDRVGLIDFGTANDPYTRDWMEDVRPRYHLEAFRPAAPATLLHLARRALGHVSPRLAPGRLPG